MGSDRAVHATVLVRHTDRRMLQRLVAGHHDTPVIDEVLVSLRRFAAGPGCRWVFGSWLELWDAFVTHHRGVLQVGALRCPECRGRRWSVRRHVPGGHICSVCMGTGRTRPTSVRLRCR